MRSWIALGLIGFLFAVVSCGANELPQSDDDTAGTQSKGGSTAMAGKSGGGGTAGSGMISCANGQKSCFMQATATTAAVTVCADTNTDRANCGACGTKCGDSQTCVAGSCSCMAPLKSCGMACVNTTSDAMNCGNCGVVCGAAAPFCSMGTCVAMCAGGETACSNNSCANTTSDPLNCGSCTNKCPGGQVCTNSVCGCGTGQFCNGACVDTMTTAANCGTCGHACAPGESCVAGVCGGTGVGGAGGMGAGGSAGAGAMSGAGGISAGAGGTAGTGMTGGPERANCPIGAGVIADFEEGATSNMPVILKQEDRTGEWEMFNDGKSTSETSVVESSGGTADCDKFALHVKGTGYNDWGAGFGFSLVGTPKMPTVYNATTHGFTGIKFKMKMGTTGDSKAPVRFNVSTPWTESAENPGGSCTPQAASTNKAAVDCYQHAGRFLYPGTGANQLTQSFQTYTYCFDRDLYPLSLPSNLTPDQRNAIGTNVLKIQFQFGQGHDYSGGYTESDYPEFAKGLPFDVWIDDVSFVSGECPNTFTSPSNGSPAKPFPQNTASTKYGSCDIATNAPAFNGQLAAAYATWTANFVRNNTVIAPEQSNVVTSESMGYGMMIAAAMGDKAAFDKFWGYVQGKLSGGLMTWKDGQSGSASDGDLDIAYALLLANAQWPSGGYKSPADTMAGNIASKDIVSNIVRGGSSFQNSNYNPSYFIPAAMRKFSSLSGAVGANYGFVNTNISAGAAKVPTDWANPSNGQPSDAGSAQVTSDIVDGSNGAMGYDAARVPWRLGQDVCLGGTEGSSSVSSMVSYFAAKYDSGARIDLMKAGWYKKSDAPHPQAKDVQGSYIGPMGVAGMAAGNKPMRDSAFRAALDIMESGDFNHTYFPCTIGFITALIMSGNFPSP